MAVQIQNHSLDSELTLRDNNQSPLTVHVALILTRQDDHQLTECCLTFQVSPKLYSYIDAKKLFNLAPDLRHPSIDTEFLPESDITIEASLKADFLPQMAEHAALIDEAATYLLNLSQEQPDSPLLSTENWFALSIKQQQESGETGYRTIWSYLTPQARSEEALSSTEITEGITNFFKDAIGSSLDTAVKEFSHETLGSLSNFFQEIAQTLPEVTIQNTTTPPIFQAVVNFFTQDDWSFTRIQGEQALHLGFQGENGTWNCYAHIREQQEQLIFYSICPLLAPENKRAAVAEFLTRANYGLFIGNFEMDFTDGEIRYKTSIDISSDELTLDAIQRLVYANVAMMDEYLPGIIAVVEKDALPVDAIVQVEN